MSSDILARLTMWYDRVPSDSALFGCSSKLLDDAAEEIRQNRMKLSAIEAMGYEWRWTKSIDENGEQVGAWVMRHDAAEADANNKAWRKSDGK
jgi:hypothetical protein